MAGSPKEEFIELMTDLQRSKGLDELTSKVIGILFIETKEVSLDELATRTGYSLSAVSTSMKMLSGSGFVKRVKKPKSKRVYFFMEKDLARIFRQTLERMDKNIAGIKSKIPGIIERYRKLRSKDSHEELRIIENYHRQLLAMERAMGKMMEMLEDV
jgi:DNA-binding transcriptional regulator GbsR (MarR family)